MIYYFCPDVQTPSSGVRLLYRHVAILNRHGLHSAVVHHAKGFRVPDTPEVPIVYLSAPQVVYDEDVIVVPEGYPKVMYAFGNRGPRVFVIALSWRYIYETLPRHVDWRAFKVRGAIVNSGFVGDFVSWAMGLPVYRVVSGIDPRLYLFNPGAKTSQVCFIKRKSAGCEQLMKVLHSRNPDFITKIKWRALEGLSEGEYAGEVCRSRVFVNMSRAEGFPFSLLEAMRAGTLVAGYNSVGGQAELIGEGNDQNCILVENLDYPTLARKLEPLLLNILTSDMHPWDHVIQNGIKLSSRYSLEEEERSVIGAWRQILVGEEQKQAFSALSAT
jgi:glycosyltransferase involved in cell wall biosynthesis